MLQCALKYSTEEFDRSIMILHFSLDASPNSDHNIFCSGSSVWIFLQSMVWTRSNSNDQAKNDRANQIARAGFIRWWTGDLQGRNHHVIKER